MIKKILIGLVGIVVLFIAVAAMQPAEFTVERSATMAAPADVVFAQVNDFHAWHAWSPWEKMDTDLKKTFEGSAAGQGAIYTWIGEKAGQGKMTIVSAKPSEQIDIKIDFVKPFEATNQIRFAFHPEGTQTKVTWSISGSKNLMSKAMGLFMSMDSMVGKDFESGLASMKSVSEAEAKKGSPAMAATPPAEAPATPAHP